MDAVARYPMSLEQDEQIASAVRRERGRLRAFIRRRVLDDGDAEDILQDVFYELVVTYRGLQPLEEVGAWLFRVARNRVTDFFRKKRPVPMDMTGEAAALSAELQDAADTPVLDELLLPADEAPDAELARQTLLEQLIAAIEELPPEQREVFVAHELDGTSFKDLAARSGIPLNTLLARKHYAVKHLRQRLQGAYDAWLED
jgi:RNA polymerase sigma factor (sigma-70 family)